MNTSGVDSRARREAVREAGRVTSPGQQGKQGQQSQHTPTPPASPAPSARREHWRRWIGERLVATGLATRNPADGSVDFPYMRMTSARIGVVGEQLRVWTRDGGIPSLDNCRRIAAAIGENVLTVLYHAGYQTLSDIEWMFGATDEHGDVTLMTEAEYREAQEQLQRDIPAYVRPLWTRILSDAWRYSAFLISVLRPLGLSDDEITDFLHRMNTQEARDALYAGVTQQSQSSRRGARIPDEFARETGPRRPARAARTTQSR